MVFTVKLVAEIVPRLTPPVLLRETTLPLAETGPLNWLVGFAKVTLPGDVRFVLPVAVNAPIWLISPVPEFNVRFVAEIVPSEMLPLFPIVTFVPLAVIVPPKLLVALPSVILPLAPEPPVTKLEPPEIVTFVPAA